MINEKHLEQSKSPTATVATTIPVSIPNAPLVLLNQNSNQNSAQEFNDYASVADLKKPKRKTTRHTDVHMSNNSVRSSHFNKFKKSKGSNWNEDLN